MTDKPQWALDKASNASQWGDYKTLEASKASHQLKLSVLAHAATLAKYETDPVDLWLIQAREIVAEHAERIGHHRMAREILSGGLDACWHVSAILFALKSDWKPE